MSLTYPDNPFLDGDLVPASRWNGRWNAIQQKFGNIVDADIASDAAINGAKLAAGTLPGDRVSAKTIAQAQLGLLSVGTPELIALAVDKTKMTTVAGARATQAQLELLVQTQTFSFSAGGAGLTTTTVTPSSAIASATNQLLAVFVQPWTSGLGVTNYGPPVVWADTVGPNYVGKISINTTGATTTYAGTLVFVYIAKT